jgi:hypothetical protein
MKRLTESGKWADPWFRALPIEAKCLWLWILDNCDCAGIIEIDMGLAEFQIGASKPLQSPFDYFGDRVQKYGSKLFVPKFIRYQYGEELNLANTAHRGVIRRLELAKIPCPVRISEKKDQAPSKPLQSPLQGAQDMDKDMDTDKDHIAKSNIKKKYNSKDAEEIYQLYPKKVAKESAVKAIAKALDKVGKETLVSAVKAYAEARKDQDQQYTPMASRWFNESRWEDDQSTWKDAPKRQMSFGVTSTHQTRGGYRECQEETPMIPEL